MRIQVAAFWLLWLFQLTAVCQNKEDVAIALYQRAENAYNISDYENVLTALESAEQTLGGTNTKILYLKIKAMDMLSKSNGKYSATMERDLAKFFSMADKSTYPQNKYSDMVLISLTVKQKATEEAEAYSKLTADAPLEVYRDFFEKYSSEKYPSEYKLYLQKCLVLK